MTDFESQEPVIDRAEASAEGEPANERQLRQFMGYETLSVLGIGGMGVVYQARQTALNRLVAIKTLRNYTDATPQDLDRFRFEAEIVAQFQHPNIVQLYHIGDQNGQPFLAFEFVEGGSLAKLINGTPQPPLEAAKQVETLARAVHAAHLRGVVHRDLTPNNVLLAADGTPKIADFGLARLQEQSGIPAESIAGTASYMAPEQAWGDVQGKSVGPLTDVYGLGAIFYELLCGRPPFKASTSQKTLQMVYHDPPVAPRSIVSATPRDLEVICLRCLKKEPNERFPSAEALADDLRRFLNGGPIKSRHVSKPERVWMWSKRNPVAFGHICGLVLMVAISFIAVTSEMLAARRAEIAERQRVDELDAALYRHQFLLARIAFDSSDVDRAIKLLDECRPQRRSFEWDYLYRQCQKRFSALPWDGGGIAELTFNPNGRSIAVAERMGTVHLIDIFTGAKLGKFVGENERTSPPVLSADAQKIAFVDSLGSDSWIRVWDTVTGTELKRIGPLKGRGFAVHFGLNSQEIYSIAFDQETLTLPSNRLLGDLITGKLRSPSKDFEGILPPPVGTRSLAIEAWNLDSGIRLSTTKGPETNCSWPNSKVKATFSPDGRYFAWTPDGDLPFAFKHRSIIQICETQTGNLLHALTEPTRMSPVQFSMSSDSSRLCSFGDHGNGTVLECLGWKPPTYTGTEEYFRFDSSDGT